MKPRLGNSAGTLVNSANPYQTPQMPQYAAMSDMGLHCLRKLQKIKG